MAESGLGRQPGRGQFVPVPVISPIGIRICASARKSWAFFRLTSTLDVVFLGRTLGAIPVVIDLLNWAFEPGTAPASCRVAPGEGATAHITHWEPDCGASEAAKLTASEGWLTAAQPRSASPASGLRSAPRACRNSPEGGSKSPCAAHASGSARPAQACRCGDACAAMRSRRRRSAG